MCYFCCRSRWQIKTSKRFVSGTPPGPTTFSFQIPTFVLLGFVGSYPTPCSSMILFSPSMSHPHPPKLFPEVPLLRSFPPPPEPSFLAHSQVSCQLVSPHQEHTGTSPLVSKLFTAQISVCSPSLLSQRKRRPFQSYPSQ